MASFKADKREDLGRKAEGLRQRGLVPAVLYGQGKPSLPLVLDAKHFLKVYQEVGEAAVADLDCVEEQTPVLVTDVQRDPVDDRILHVDFHRVRSDEAVTIAVPIEVLGEPAVVKSGQGMLLTLLPEIELECLPKDIPAKLEIDITHLEAIDSSVAVKELPLDFSKVKLVGNTPEDLVVKIVEATMAEEEPAAEEVTVEAVEATAEKGKEEEGDEGADKDAAEK